MKNMGKTDEQQNELENMKKANLAKKYNRYFTNDHKKREEENDRKMLQASSAIFGAKSFSTYEEMEARRGYRYFYINDGKWQSDKAHFQYEKTKWKKKNNTKYLHDNPWNNNFGNAQSLGSLNSLLAQRAKSNLELHGKTHSETKTEELNQRKAEFQKEQIKRIKDLKKLAKTRSKWNNNFSKANSITSNLNDVAKNNLHNNQDVKHQGDIKYWINEAKNQNTHKDNIFI